MQNNTECKTTDRITGRATTRGHTESLETEVAALRQYVADLRSQCQENGIEARPPPMIPPPFMPPGMHQGAMGWPGQPYGTQMWDAPGMGQAGPDSLQRHSSVPLERPRGPSSALPEFKPGCKGDNYLGVSSGNERLSAIKGSSMSLFGMDLDLADYLPADDPASPSSYETFLKVAFGRQSQAVPEMPPYENAKIYCKWFFQSIHPFSPTLDKRAFMAMFERLHNDQSYQPSAAETVQLHMILAIMMFQFSKRNETQHDWSQHYLYSLSFLHELMAGHSLENMQAIALICLHMRNFEKPGPGWMMSSIAINLAVELGLHRSIKAWQPKSDVEKDPRKIDIRQRVWWSLLLYHFNLSRQLGRPMTIHLEDIDVEIPEPMDDYLPDEYPNGPTEWQKCSYRAGIYCFQWAPLAIQVHTLVYPVRTPTQPYDATVRRLHKEIEIWFESIPLELKDQAHIRPEDRAFALYLGLGAEQLQLLLHHPSVCLSQSPETINRCLDICLESGIKMLHIASGLRQLRSLGGTLQDTTIFLAAIFTSIYVFSERKDQITSADLNDLKGSMDAWLDVMGDVGQSFGKFVQHYFKGLKLTFVTDGPRLQNALRQIITDTTGNLSRHIAAKTASAAVASANITRSPTAGGPPPEGYIAAYGYGSAQGQQGPTSDATTGSNYNIGPEEHQPGSYPSANHFAYPDPASGYPSNALPFESQYQEDIKPDMQAQLAAHNASLPTHHHHQTPRQPTSQPLSQHEQQAQSFLHTFGSPPPPPPPQSVYPPQNADGGQQPQQQHPQTQASMGMPAAWRHFSEHMNSGANGQYGSASALMALAKNSEGMTQPAEGAEQTWPTMLYSSGGQ